MKFQEIKIGGRKSFMPQNIILFEGDINYSHVYLNSGEKITVATTLKELEKRFQAFDFYRSHKKYLVNINAVKSFGQFTVSLVNKKEILVSRRRRDGLAEKLIVNKGID